MALIRRIAVVGSVAALGVLAFAGSAQALSCGQTVNKSVKLKQNLNCPASQGLRAGKNGITINLNGHTITGGGGAGGYNGIEVVNRNRVTIKNGTIKNFFRGALISHAVRTSISRVKVVANGTQSYNGIYSEYSSRGTFTKNKVNNAYYAFYSRYGAANEFTANKVFKPYYGFYIVTESGTRVLGAQSIGDGNNTIGIYDANTFQNLYSGNVLGNGENGIYVGGQSRGLRIVKNRANGNDFAGLYLTSNDPSYHYEIKVSGNTTNNNGSYGIYSSYQGGAVGRGNNATGNSNTDCFLAICNG